MEATKNPDYLRATARSVDEFREALTRFLKFHAINEDLARGIAPAVFPLEKAVLKISPEKQRKSTSPPGARALRRLSPAASSMSKVLERWIQSLPGTQSRSRNRSSNLTTSSPRAGR